MSRTVFLPTMALAAAALVASCASSPERPTAELTRARTLIEQAERNQAQQFAAVDLNRARDKLRLSDTAMNSDNAEVARRLATEAALDAELAMARSSTAQAENSAAEIGASVEALRSEAGRDVRRP